MTVALKTDTSVASGARTIEQAATLTLTTTDDNRAGVCPSILRHVDRQEEAMIAENYRETNEIESQRFWDFAQDCRHRSLNPDDDETQQVHARLIALEMASNIDYRDLMLRNPEIDPDYEVGRDALGDAQRDMVRIYNLTEAEGEAIRAAAEALLALPAISYRKPVRYMDAEAAQIGGAK